jgi:hypothetical protein
MAGRSSSGIRRRRRRRRRRKKKKGGDDRQRRKLVIDFFAMRILSLPTIIDNHHLQHNHYSIMSRNLCCL